MQTLMVLLAVLTVVLGLTWRPQAQTEQAQDKARREVAVTFDDLPAAPGNSRLAEINRKLVEGITRHNIPAVGFVNESKLYAPGETDMRVALLRMWLDAGLELGNHTFSHIQIDRSSLADYQEDVIRGETVTRLLLRHANELNADHFDALIEMIKKRGYRFIPLEEALKDKAYRLPTAHTRQGLSWLHRWRMAKGLKLRLEPREPEWINSLIESYARRDL